MLHRTTEGAAHSRTWHKQLPASFPPPKHRAILFEADAAPQGAMLHQAAGSQTSCSRWSPRAGRACKRCAASACQHPQGWQQRRTTGGGASASCIILLLSPGPLGVLSQGRCLIYCSAQHSTPSCFVYLQTDGVLDPAAMYLRTIMWCNGRKHMQSCHACSRIAA